MCSKVINNIVQLIEARISYRTRERLLLALVLVVPAKVTYGTHWCVRTVSTLATFSESLLVVTCLFAARQWFGFIGADPSRVIPIKVFVGITKTFHFLCFTINIIVVAECTLGRKFFNSFVL